jgi:release factor glutamine methyltransferase
LIAHPERPLNDVQRRCFDDLLARRAAGEPLAYLLGSAYFYGLEFAVSPDVLIPRADTEVLVEQARQRAAAFAAPRIVDLGTGSGIVAVVLARECPHATLTAVDLSPEALAVARVNALRHAAAVRFLQGDWYAPVAGERFELIVANPPYVAAGDAHLQHDGLPFEPQLALTDGVPGSGGLACIRAIVSAAPAHLSCGGWLLIEHGYDQAVQVRELLHGAGFSEIDSWHDGAGIERVSGGRFP